MSGQDHRPQTSSYLRYSALAALGGIFEVSCHGYSFRWYSSVAVWSCFWPSRFCWQVFC